MSEPMTLGDVLLLRQLAAMGAVSYVGTGPSAEQRLDALSDARRRARLLVAPQIAELEGLRALLQENDARAERTSDDEDESRDLLERINGLLRSPAGAPVDSSAICACVAPATVHLTEMWPGKPEVKHHRCSSCDEARPTETPPAAG